MRAGIHRRDCLRLALAALATVGAGCGYSIRPPYNASIRTVYVPVFKSYRFRTDLNIQLTKLLIDEINTRTPYRVVANPENADARLEGTVTFDDKNVMVENPYNLPRHILASMTVNVTFTDNRNQTAQTKTFPAAVVSESVTFDPEIGESSTAGFEKAMKKIVRDIVNMMEEPWGEEYQLREQAPDATDSSDSGAIQISR